MNDSALVIVISRIVFLSTGGEDFPQAATSLFIFYFFIFFGLVYFKGKIKTNIKTDVNLISADMR